MDRATISLFLVYSSLSLTDGRKKKNVGGRDPISRRAGCGTGSGWTVAQLLERGRGYRYETARRAYAATKEAGPPRIKLRSFASSGRWSRASTRPIFDRDPGMYLSCHLLHFSFPFSITLRIFVERILRYLILNFFFFLKTIEAIGKGTVHLYCIILLLSIEFHRKNFTISSFEFLFFSSRSN